MSRTDKDRPEWVRANDPTLEMEYRHNHIDFNKVDDISYHDRVYTYHYYGACTAFDENRPPVFPKTRIYGEVINGEVQMWQNPCIRTVARSNRLKLQTKKKNSGRKVRAKNRDSLRAVKKTFNANVDFEEDFYFLED